MACGACQFLRRKCGQSCIFAPYFRSKEMGIEQFRAIHTVFGASHFAKLLLQMPTHERHDAAGTILYEAETRLRYPIHGCYSKIYGLKEEIKNLNEQLAAAYGELAACRSLDVATINTGQYVNNHIPKYVNGNQPEITDIRGPSNPSEQNYVPLDYQQSIPSQNCAVNNDHAEAETANEESNYLPVYLQGQHSISGDMSSLNTTSSQHIIVMDCIPLGRLARNALK